VTIPLCAAIFACFVLGWNWFAPWLHLPASHASDGKEAVLIVLGVYLSSIAFSAFGDMLTGTQQIASTQVFQIVSILAEFALIVWLVSAGRGIRGLAEAYLARIVINDGLTWWWAHRTIKWLHLSPRRVHREFAQICGTFRRAGPAPKHTCNFPSLSRSPGRTYHDRRICRWFAGCGQKMADVSFNSIPTAFFAALLPAASHVDAASDRSTWQANMQDLYLTGARYSNLCTAAFASAMAFWSVPIMHVWLGPALPMRDSLIPLFVLSSISMQFHMLTGPGTSIFAGWDASTRNSITPSPTCMLLAVTLPLARWIEGRWTPFGIGVAVSVATAVYRRAG
jgi:O-antigen/teichoic acid export membrane protein